MPGLNADRADSIRFAPAKVMIRPASSLQAAIAHQEPGSALAFVSPEARAEELDTTLFIHPQSTPELANRFKGNGWLSNVIGRKLVSGQPHHT